MASIEMTKIDNDVQSAMEELAETEAITLRALARVDMANIVAMIERDVLTGEMSVGQRKSAHLLLKYYAPQKAQNPQANQALTHASELPMASILRMIEAIDGSILDPSQAVLGLEAGVLESDQVVSDLSLSSSNSESSVESDSVENFRRNGKLL